MPKPLNTTQARFSLLLKTLFFTIFLSSIFILVFIFITNLTPQAPVHLNGFYIKLVLGIALIEGGISIGLLLYIMVKSWRRKTSFIQWQKDQKSAVHLLKSIQANKLPEDMLRESFVFSHLMPHAWIDATYAYFQAFLPSHLESLRCQLETGGICKILMSMMREESDLRYRLRIFFILGYFQSDDIKDFLIPLVSLVDGIEKEAALLALAKQGDTTFEDCFCVLEASSDITWVVVGHILSQFKEGLEDNIAMLLALKDPRLVLGTLIAMPIGLIQQQDHALLHLILTTPSEPLQKIAIARISQAHLELPIDILEKKLQEASAKHLKPYLLYCQNHKPPLLLSVLIERLKKNEPGIQLDLLQTVLAYGHIGKVMLAEMQSDRSDISYFLDEKYA